MGPRPVRIKMAVVHGSFVSTTLTELARHCLNKIAVPPYGRYPEMTYNVLSGTLNFYTTTLVCKLVLIRANCFDGATIKLANWWLPMSVGLVGKVRLTTVCVVLRYLGTAVVAWVTSTALSVLQMLMTVTVFVRGQVQAEMKKGVTYLVDIKLSQQGDIMECQCECAAGVGPSAHCKHVCAILYAVHDVTVNRNIKMKLTCTKKIQSFHKSKKIFRFSR